MRGRGWVGPPGASFSAAEFAVERGALEERHPLRATLMDRCAYLGRYAHQPVRETLRLTMRDVVELVAATGRILEEEARANREAAG